MKAPYTYTLRDNHGTGLVLAASTPLDTTLAAVEAAGHKHAAEWIASDLVDSVWMDITDARGTRVRAHLVTPRRGTTVRERQA